MMLHACSAFCLFIFCLCARKWFELYIVVKMVEVSWMMWNSHLSKTKSTRQRRRRWQWRRWQWWWRRQRWDEVNRPALMSVVLDSLNRPQAILIQIENYYRQSIRHHQYTHTQSRHSRDRRVNNETEHNTKQEIPDWNMTFSNVVRHTVIVICRFPIDFITLYYNFSTLQFPCACCSISHARSFCRYLHWFSRINNCFVFIRR